MFGRTKELERKVRWLESRIEDLNSKAFAMELKFILLMKYLEVKEVTTRAETKIIKIEEEQAK